MIKGLLNMIASVHLKSELRKVKEGKAGLIEIQKGLGRLFITTEFAKRQPPEKGYVYFQDFIPNLDSDIRIQVIQNRIFGLKRFVRENDFRASGSEDFIHFNPDNIDKKILNCTLSLIEKVKYQCLTIDFIYINDEPHIVELSYGFPIEFYDDCTGYWDFIKTKHKLDKQIRISFIFESNAV